MTPEQAYDYCEKHGRNNKLEKIILTNALYSYYYALHIIQGRWKKAENIIATDPESSCLYAMNIIRGRWLESENIIATDSYFACRYAQLVIKGKLPEFMHNAMLLYADCWAKEYVKFINKLTPTV